MEFGNIKELVYLIVITNIQLKQGEIFFGEKALNGYLSKVGSAIDAVIPVTYRPEEIEKELSLSYKLDYQYIKKVKTTRKDGGTYKYDEELVRDSYEKRFSSKVFFVNPGEQT